MQGPDCHAVLSPAIIKRDTLTVQSSSPCIYPYGRTLQERAGTHWSVMNYHQMESTTLTPSIQIFNYSTELPTLYMASDQLLQSIRFSPIEESELGRINELSNIPDIAENFETIPPVSMETTRAMWNYMHSGIVSLWGIRLHDRIIGGVGFSVQPPGTRLSHTATFFLYVEPAYWGKGIGKASIQFIEKVVQDRGYVRIECMVSGRNQRAIGLYGKLGYEQEGVKKQAFFIDGAYADLIIMGKVFSSRTEDPG